MSFSSDIPLLANQLPISVELPDVQQENGELLVEQLELLYKRIANSVNTKTGSLFSLNEVADFELWYTPQATVAVTGNAFAYRNGYRRTYEITVPIAAGATSTTAHGLTGFSQFTKIYGTCTTNVIDYRPLPYVTFNGAGQISLTVTPTDIVIVNGSAAIITNCMVVLEFLKV